MTSPWEGALVYALKEQCKASEPPHWICTKCYEDGRKSILNPVAGARGFFKITCPICKSEIQSLFTNAKKAEYVEDSQSLQEDQRVKELSEKEEQILQFLYDNDGNFSAEHIASVISTDTHTAKYHINHLLDKKLLFHNHNINSPIEYSINDNIRKPGGPICATLFGLKRVLISPKDLLVAFNNA